jgi:hypothetical protein
MIEEIIQFNISNLGNFTKYEQVQYVNTQPYWLTAALTMLGLYIIINLVIGFTKVTGRPNSKICFQSNVYWKTFLIPLFTIIIAYILLFVAPIIFNVIGG